MPEASEGLANAWVEALACGTPIVISDAGGEAELVTSSVAGRIVSRTPAAIAEAVQTLLAAPPAPADVAASLGGRFDWARNGRELARSEEHTSELQSLMHITYSVFCLKTKKTKNT